MEKFGKLDELTGLYTRSALEKLNFQFSSNDKIWSMMILDIDHFKLINDIYGHLEGDIVIQRIAKILACNTRKTDTLIRYGGDEFLIILPDTTQENAKNLADEIFHALKREVFPAGMKIELSVGIAESNTDDLHLAEIFDRADQALYKSKSDGRGRISIFSQVKKTDILPKLSFSHFIGRDSELSKLKDITDHLITDKGHFALVSGEIGIGKSRLIDEFEKFTKIKFYEFITINYTELNISKALKLLIEPIETLLKTFTDTELSKIKIKIPEVIQMTAELFPSLNLHVTLAKSTNHDIEKFQLYSEIFSIFEFICQRRKVIFFVDSIQWMNDQDFDLFSYLIRASQNLPVLFLATLRTPVKDSSHIEKNIKILSNLINYTHIPLENLSNENIQHLIMLALHDSKTPEIILEKLINQSNGNPMFLKELLHSLIENKAIQPSEDGTWKYQFSESIPLPETISQLMSARISKLDSLTKEVICTASLIIGNSFSLDPLCYVLDYDEISISKSIDKALKLGIIEISNTKTRTSEYRFIQNSMSSFLHQEIPQETRKALQAKLGQFYEIQFKSGNRDIIPIVAHHYCNSNNSQKASEYALIAANQVQKANKQEIINWLEQYISHSNEDEDVNSIFKAKIDLGNHYTFFAQHDKATSVLEEVSLLNLNDIQLGELYFREAQLLFNMGDHAKADVKYKEAIKYLPLCEEQIIAQIQIASILYFSGRIQESYDVLSKVYDNISAIEDEYLKTVSLASYYNFHGIVAMDILPQTECTKECMKSAQLFRHLGDKNCEARALLNTSVTLRRYSNVGERIGILNDALKILIQIGDSHAIMAAYVNLGQNYQNVMEFDIAKDYFTKCVELIEVTGTKRFGVWAYSHLGTIHTSEGNFAIAETFLKKALESALNLGLAPMAETIKINLIESYLFSGEIEKANALLEPLEKCESNSEESIIDFKNLRALEQLRNKSLDRKSALMKAENLLREVIEYYKDSKSLQYVESMQFLIESLYYQGRTEECTELLTHAKKKLEDYASEIDTLVFQKNILNSQLAKELDKLESMIGNKN